MLTCSVCRSQNMETAKFCGNCGNPFPRPSMPTSSLINCPQGHVYSAVYQFCPYCPQPEPITQSGPPSDFATRIEEPVTAFEPPGPPPSSRLESYATNFETRVGGVEVFETRVAAVEVTEFAEPPVGKTAPQKASAPTEVISKATAIKVAETQVTPSESPAMSAPTVMETRVTDYPSPALPPDPTIMETRVTDFPSAPLPKAPPPAPPVAPAPLAQTVIVESPPSLTPPAPADLDRRTLVVAEGTTAHSSKGKIVGWLISYTRNADGEDFRLYAGYNRIGANPVCDIVLQDETVSGSHAIIVYRDGRFLVKDDLSRNGTFVNGREISEAHPLQSYDQVRIGNTYLTFIAAQRIA